MTGLFISLVDWNNGIIVLAVLAFVIIALIATLVIFMNSGRRKRR
ncbi:MAG: hypothetical protein ACR2MM_13360 [Flavobacteriaceae bacterium]